MEAILRSARDANMNMLRIWGGGTYQRDAFYAMADRLGLMIWQEFMFGGAMHALRRGLPRELARRGNRAGHAVCATIPAS